jgi:two-component system OmpR family sensor kinase
MRRLPPAPLFLQTLGLVFAALVAAQLATVIVLLNLPPPAADVYSVEDVAAAVEGVITTSSQTVPPLIIERSSKPPTATVNGRRRAAFRIELARTLGVDPSRVVVSQPGPSLLPFGIPRQRPPWTHPGGRPGRTFEPLMFGRFAVGVRQADGSWLIAHTRKTAGVDPWQQRMLLVFGLTLLGVSPLAWIFSRRLTAPIVQLSAGAQRLGRDPNAPPLMIRGGSPEVAEAVAAYNEMQARLQSYVAERTAMVAAIAHDLRTPLTRLRFRAERASPDLRDLFAADIEQMDAMISGALGFVRDTAPPAHRERLELSALVETAMDEAAQVGGQLSFDKLERAYVTGDPLALKRLVANLIDNALKFGGSAKASVFVADETAIVRIEDDGPGIPEHQMRIVFEPFRRLETSRNRDTGGTGLGLAVVRAIATSHGGEVVLDNLSGGGLGAELRLPRALGEG